MSESRIVRVTRQQQPTTGTTTPTYSGCRLRMRQRTHRDTTSQCDTSAAVSVGHDIPVADAEKGYGDQPHRVQQIRMILVMEPVAQRSRQS